jgi:hypothetical protein
MSLVNDVTPTLKFLTDAGHLLAATVPATSAYLLSRRNELMFEHEMPLSDKHRQQVCTCCGHIMMLGQGSVLEVDAAKKDTKSGSVRGTRGSNARATREQPRSTGPTKTITCGHCGRLTKVKLPAPGPISRLKVKTSKMSSSSLPSALDETQPPKPTASASSKKRAKSRKAGLQALLNQSKATRNTRSGLGLSLADFMERK